MPTKIRKMEQEIESLKELQAKGSKSSPSGNSIKFDIAWLQQAIEQEKYMAEKMRFDSNLGKRFMSRTFETFEEESDPSTYQVVLGYTEAKVYERDEKNSLLLMGGCGTGKTHLAAAVANRLVKEGVRTLFGTYSEFLDKLRKEFDYGENKMLAQLKNVSFLVLDDVGKEKKTEWTTQILFDIVNHRYEAMLPMMITTNFNQQELEAHVGEATYSRLCEMCSGLVTHGIDKRKE